jgi:hypothetical protein
MEGDGSGYIPVQYISKNTKATIVINDAQDDKDHIEEVLCGLLGIKTTTGKVRFGDTMTNKEALAYNRGFEAGLAMGVKNLQVIDGPDMYLAGEKVITGPKKRKLKKKGIFIK